MRGERATREACCSSRSSCSSSLAAGAGWWWVAQLAPALDGRTGACLVCSGPVEVVCRRLRRAARLRARRRRCVVRGRRPARARPAVADGALSPGHRGPAVGGARRADAADRPALPDAGLRAAAEAEWQRLGAAGKRGARALRRRRQRRRGDAAGPRSRPLEFQLLGITPAPWTPVDSLAVGRLLAWRLAENHRRRARPRCPDARSSVPTAADALTGRYPDSGPTVLGDVGRAGRRRRPPAAPPPTGAGRAGRAVGAVGSRRRSAAPIRRRSPGSIPTRAARQQQQLGRRRARARPPGGRSWPTIRTCRSSSRRSGTRCTWWPPGSTCRASPFPGVPFVAIGHNARIAWGITNTGADVQDLVRRARRPGRQARAGPAQGWEPVQVEDAPIPGARPGRAGAVRGVEDADGRDLRRRVGLDWEAPPSWLSPDAPRAGRAARARAASGRASTAATSPTRSRRSTAPATGPTFQAALDRCRRCRRTSSMPTSTATSATR